MALGGTAAWWLAVELGARRPIFAALVPLVAMAGDPFAAVFVTLGRIVGVFAGVGVGIAFIHAGLPSTARVALVLLCGAAGSVLLRVGGRPNLEVPIAALFMLGVGTATAGRFGVQRIWETGIGGAIAIAVSAFLWPPDPVRELRRQLGRLRRDLVADLARIAVDLALGTAETAEQIDAVRAHSREAVRDVFDLDSARRALRWSPLRRGDIPEVDELERRINLAARVYRHTRALARDVTDIPLVDEQLAAATRDLADAADRLLTGADPAEPLARAGEALAGSGSVVGAQLRQLLADLRAFDG
ncbi:MAG TPA: FUSC family protein [Gaiellaceae bacterium]|nr:FUSC family protein [Gaiellaceae bacterium]